MSTITTVVDSDPAAVAQQFGKILRSIRQELGMSLGGVEEKSQGLWKAVVVGSYERGDRNATLARIGALLAWYTEISGRDHRIAYISPDHDVVSTRANQQAETWVEYGIRYDSQRPYTAGDENPEPVYQWLSCTDHHDAAGLVQQFYDGRVDYRLHSVSGWMPAGTWVPVR